MSKGIKVISCPFGGLGDWLLLSTLPRRFHDVGYEVFIHEGPLAQFRNAGIRDIILSNPYLSKENGGRSKHPPNAGHGVYIDIWGRYCWETRLRPRDCIAVMEEMNDLEPPYSHHPEIYLKPQSPLQMRDDVIIVDPYSSSVPFTQDSIGPWIDYYKTHYGERTFHVLETPGHAAFHRALFGFPKIEVKSLQEYVNLLWSTHAFFGVESGGQMLAAAVKKDRPELRVHACFSTRGFNQKFYTLRDDIVDYSPSAFVLQNDFAIDPGQLGYRHIIETAAFAEKARAKEAEAVPEPMTVSKLLAMRQPGEIVGEPDPADPGFPLQDVSKRSA